MSTFSMTKLGELEPELFCAAIPHWVALPEVKPEPRTAMPFTVALMLSRVTPAVFGPLLPEFAAPQFDVIMGVSPEP
jgi:hypothetical protein